MRRPDDPRQLSELLAQRFYRDMHTPPRRGRLWSLVDLGELAVRLGSPVAYDRHGDVIWYDDFSGGLGRWSWTPAAGEPGRVVWCRHAGRSGAHSARLICSSAQPGPAITHRAVLPLTQPRPRLGAEFSFTYDEGLAWLSLGITVYLGGGVCPYSRFGLRAWPYEARLEVLGPGSAWEALPVEARPNPFPHFNTCKLVVDPAGRYTRVLFNEYELPLDGRLPDSGLSSGSSAWAAAVSAGSLEGETGSLWVDDVILTVNE